MRRHSHDGTGPVTHQYVVCDPYRQSLLVHGIHGIATGEDSRLLLIKLLPLKIALPRRILAVGLDSGLLSLARDDIDKRMFRRKYHIGRPEQRIRPGREHSDGARPIGKSEVHLSTD